MGDVHIYESHVDAIKSQLERIPYLFPVMMLPKIGGVEDIENLQASEFVLIDYHSHPSVKVDMVA